MKDDAQAFEDRYLSDIRPSYDLRGIKYYPASVRLKSGELVEEVIFIDRTYAKRVICSFDWLEAHGNQLWDQVMSIGPMSVESVLPSKYRLSPELVFEMYRKQGYRLFIAKDDRPMLCAIYPCVRFGLMDFPKLPEGYGPNDIVKVMGYDYIKSVHDRQAEEDQDQERYHPTYWTSLRRRTGKYWKE